MAEKHRKVCTALSDASEVGRVTEHFGKRHSRIDLVNAVVGFHTRDFAATSGNASHTVAEIIFGGGNFDLHNRFKKDRTCFFATFLESH